jgi:hypothetical protein
LIALISIAPWLLASGFSPSGDRPSIRGLRLTTSSRERTAALAEMNEVIGGASWPRAMEPMIVQKNTDRMMPAGRMRRFRGRKG